MLIDTHCHLIDKRYNKSPKQLIQEGKKEGVARFINVGTSVESSEEAIKLARNNTEVFATVGIYPHRNRKEDIPALRARLQKLIQSSDKVVGVGECGIDVSDGQGRPIESQKELFEMQIDLAIENNLPVVIHNRNGDEIILEILEKYKNRGLRGVLHCFVSDWEFAKKMLEIGFYISFTAIITYPSGKSVLEIAKRVPLEKILVETDAPYLSPQNLRRQVNEPKYVKITAKLLAEAKGMSFKDFSDATYKNSCQLFTQVAKTKDG